MLPEPEPEAMAAFGWSEDIVCDVCKRVDGGRQIGKCEVEAKSTEQLKLHTAC